MRPDERLAVARASYAWALALARARSTAASWRRLVAASRNVRDALRARDRARDPAPVRASPSPDGDRRREGSLLPLVPPAGRAGEPGAAAAAAVRLDAPARLAPEPRPALAAEIARARALMAESRRLVAEAQALRAEIARIAASWALAVAPAALTE